MRYFLLLIFTILSDQISKFYIVEYFSKTNLHLKEVTSFFNLVLVYNKGISFGLFSHFENINFVFTIVAIVILCIILYCFFKTNSDLEKISLSLVMGGAVGNIIDRFYYKAVVDFLDFHINNLYWPAFNFADSFITIGAIFLVISSFKKDKNLKV